MDQVQLSRLEGLCADMYSSSSQEARRVAHDTLMPLLNQVVTIPQLEFVLANSSNPHAILFASNGLIQLITNNWTSLSELQREELKSFLLSYLSSRCSEMYANPLTEQAMSFMVRLLCRVVKLAWLDGPKFQTITSDVQRLIDSGSIAQAILAVDVYTALTVEMQPTKGAQMARHRRTAMSFRDVSLASIFQTAMKILQSMMEGKLNITNKAEESRLVHKVLKLVVGSLSFDFMGTMPDETADDQSTVMVPYTWTNVKDLSYPGLFFTLYSACVVGGRKSCAILCLQCLVLFASLRRSLYSKEEERSAMLSSYIKGTSDVLTRNLGLDDPECYHEFCRLLGRVNAANQLTELSSNAQFGSWIDQVFAFTSGALKRVNKLPNSMHYLLGFWTVMVAPLTSMGARAPGQVKQYLEQLLVLYIHSRLQMSENEDETDPLEDETLLFEQLDVVTAISKLHLQPAFDALSRGLESARDEKTIVWIVYLMAALLAGQVETLAPIVSRARSVDGADSGSEMAGPAIELSKPYVTVGELSKHVFSLMARTDETTTVSEHLELAYLYFLDQFKKLYLAEQAKVTALSVPRAEGARALCQAVGAASDADLIDLIVRKIVNNFTRRSYMEAVLKKTLGFTNDFLNGTAAIYTDSRSGSSSLASELASNERIKYLLAHPEAIDFNRIDKNYNTVYYSIIFKLTFGEKMTVDWTHFDGLFAQIASAGVTARSTDQGKRIVTLARDLKGVSIAASNSDNYNQLFRYLVNNPKQPANCKICLFSAAADVWWDEPQVVVPVLKFIADFAHNRQQRIAFDANSPNGILLFREAVKVLSAYGQCMLQRPASFAYKDVYEEKYKGIGAALSLFTNTLGGGYANLGIFELYGDNTLQVSMSTALALCLSIPLSDLSAYLKSLKSVYTFIELVTKSHMASLVALGATQFATLLRALEDGLTSFDTAVALSCCVAVDNICTYMHDTKEPAEDVAAVQALLGNADVQASLSRQLHVINYLAMSGDFASTWSLSRPMLGLILLAKNEFVQLRASIVAQQVNPERKQQVENCYKELMEKVADNLETRNREMFTKNLYQFGISLRNK